jgi:nitrate reductase beta subunit
MITSGMVSKVYDRINFQDHGPEGIAEGLEEVFRDNLAELLEGADLAAVRAALIRETVIREVMRDSGEDRQTVTDMLDAMRSMGEEAVLDLMEGEPTTLHAAVQRYVDELRGRDELQPRDRVVDDLETLLAYPWPGESEGS